jgi:tetratricopeptide (TPR) repeat protein
MQKRGKDLPRAAFWCEKAAAHALEGNDLHGAIERAERAVGLGAEGEVRGLSRLVEAQARFFLGEYGQAEISAREAGKLLASDDGWFAAVAEEIAALGQQAKFDEVEELVQAALARNPAGAEPRARLQCLIRGASYLIPGGRLELGRRILRIVEHETKNAQFIAVCRRVKACHIGENLRIRSERLS